MMSKPLDAPIYTLCVDGPEFARRLHEDIHKARERVWVQTLSWEGDAAGLGLTRALLDSRADDRRVIADSVTEVVVNDRFRFSPAALLDRSLQDEVRATARMAETLRDNGVGVLHVDPIGLALHRVPTRNHKKLAVIDNRIAYLGGINFTDHNFAWHDLMVRIEDPAMARYLAEDMEATWNGRARSSRGVFGKATLYCSDGMDNGPMRDALRDVIGCATDRIVLQCPYVSDPLFAWLGDARRCGVRVTVLIPEAHNRPLMKEGIVHACREQGLEVLINPAP